MSGRSRLALAVLALLALAAVLLLLQARDGPAPEPPAGARAEQERAVSEPGPTASATAAREAVGVGPDVAVAQAETGAAAATGLGAIHVRALWTSGAPAAGIDLNVAPRRVPIAAADERTAVTDDSGESAFEGLRPGSYRIYRSAKTAAEVEVTAGATAEVELRLEPGFAVDGRVVEVDGRPVAGADIWMARSHVGAGFDQGRVVAVSDARGAFHLEQVDDLRLIAALAPGRAPSRRYEVSGAAGAEVPLVIVAGARGGAVRGVVRDHLGRLVAGAKVRIGPQRGYGEVRFESGFASVDPAPVTVETAGEGRFEALGLAPGARRVTVALPRSDQAPWSQLLTLAAGDEVELEVTLELGFTVAGTVYGAAGEALPGAAVWAGGRNPLPFVDPVRCDGEGRFRVGGLPAGRVVMTASADAGVVESTLEGRPGQVLRWEPVLGTGLWLRGHVLDDGDRPLAQWRVEAVPLDQPWERSPPAATDERGRFALAGLRAAPHRLQVSRRAGAAVRLVVEPVQPGGAELTLRVSAASEASAFVRGTVVGSDGRGAPASHVTVHCRALHWGTDAEVDPRTGAFELGPLPPGEYAGRVWSTLHVERPLDPFVLVAGEHRDLGSIQVARGGDLVVELTPPELVPAPASGARLNVTVFDAAGDELASCFREAGEARPMSPLPAGRYTLGVYGTRLLPRTQAFALAEGEETRVAVRLARAASCTFRITLAPEVARNQWIRLRVDAGGEPVLRVRFHGSTVDSWLTPFSAGVPDGHLTVMVIADSGHRAEAEVAVQGADREVDLPVR